MIDSNICSVFVGGTDGTRATKPQIEAPAAQENAQPTAKHPRKAGAAVMVSCRPRRTQCALGTGDRLRWKGCQRLKMAKMLWKNLTNQPKKPSWILPQYLQWSPPCIISSQVSQ